MWLFGRPRKPRGFVGDTECEFCGDDHEYLKFVSDGVTERAGKVWCGNCDAFKRWESLSIRRSRVSDRRDDPDEHDDDE